MKSMTIGRQLLLLVAAFLAAMIAGGSCFFYVVARSSSVVEDLAETSNRNTDSLFALVTSVSEVQKASLEMLRSKDPDAIEALIHKRDAMSTEVSQSIRTLGTEAGAVSSAFEDFGRANARGTEALLHGEVAIAEQILIEDSNPAFGRLLGAISGFQQSLNRTEDAAQAEGQTQTRRLQILVLILMLAVGGTLAFFGIYVARHISSSLRRTVNELRVSCDHTASASGQISAASQAQAQGASRQAASLEETSAASEQINSMAAKNGENAQSVALMMAQASTRFGEANSALEQMVKAMGEIHAAGQGVSQIMKVVDEIAFQTNILALNAAVEAARAGQAGAGFAVVADEVRNLAQRCSQASQETSGLIEESIAKSSDGRAQVNRVAELVQAITGDTAKMKDLTEQVNQGSQEQARGTRQISKSILEIERVTQQAAASAQQSASAAVELDQQSQSLRGIVGRLSTFVEGDAAVSVESQSRLLR